MSRTDLCYATCCLSTQTVTPTLAGLQCIKRCVQYMASQPHKPILTLIILIMDQMLSGLHGMGIKFNNTKPIIVWNIINMKIMPEFSTEYG